MSSSTPSHSSPTKPRGWSSLPLPTPSLSPKTPKKRDPTTGTILTPNTRGTAVRQKQDGNSDRIDKHDREDLGSRVLVDYEVFMKYVLHVPEDWETDWKPTLDAVKADANFQKFHKNCCGLCDGKKTPEKDFYPPLVHTANAVLDVVSRSNFEGITPGKHQYYRVNDPSCISGGVMNKHGLSPDLVLLDQDFPDTSTPLRWANPLHVLEVKPHDNAICDGEDMPRLVVNGKCPAGSFCVRL